MLVRSGAVDVVAIDSVAALTPRVELEGQMGDQTVAPQARMMSQAMRKLAGNLNRTRHCASSPTRSAKRSASCSALRRPSPADAR